MNSNTNEAGYNPYGTLHINLIRQLYKAGRNSEIFFTLYVSARAGARDGNWQFSETDIRHNTGIHRKLVKANCEAFVNAGLFVSDGTTKNGSPCYKLNKAAFDTYLKGNTTLVIEKVCPKKWGKKSQGGIIACQGKGYHSLLGGLAQPDRGGLALPDSLPYQAMIAKKEYKKEELKNHELTQEPVSECVCVLSPDEQARTFLTLVNQVLSDSPGFTFVITNKASATVTDFFANNPTLTPQDVAATLESALTSRSMLSPISEGYNPNWFTQRCDSLNWFLAQYHKIAGELATFA